MAREGRANAGQTLHVFSFVCQSMFINLSYLCSDSKGTVKKNESKIINLRVG